MRTKTVEVSPNFWANLEKDYASGALSGFHKRLTVVGLAKELSVSPEMLRKLLREHYGDRIQFRRGRTGGIVLQAS